MDFQTSAVATPTIARPKIESMAAPLLKRVNSKTLSCDIDENDLLLLNIPSVPCFRDESALHMSCPLNLSDLDDKSSFHERMNVSWSGSKCNTFRALQSSRSSSSSAKTKLLQDSMTRMVSQGGTRLTFPRRQNLAIDPKSLAGECRPGRHQQRSLRRLSSGADCA